MAQAKNFSQQPDLHLRIENVATFRRIQEPQEIFCMPETRDRRKLTDVAFLIILGVFLATQLSLMAYALSKSDINRMVHGFDSCGNVCGSKNSPVDGIECSGQDMTSTPYLNDIYMNRSCVSSCSVYSSSCYLSYPNRGFYGDVSQRIGEDSTNLIILCFVGLALAIVALTLFRYFVRPFVWSMVIAFVLLILAITGLMWYEYSASETTSKQVFLVWSICFTFLSLIFTICILVLIPRIKLIIRFFEEAIVIVFAMPQILLEPLLTFVANFVILGLFVYTFVLMMTAGNLELHYDGTYRYVADTATNIAVVLSIIMMVWMLQFVLACQQMVISGAVTAYYFATDKLSVVSPIYNSFYNLVRFHLGSVSYGSLIITIISIIQMILRSASNNNGWLRLVYICCKPLENLLRYLTSMGYIQVAMHGQELCRSCMRGFELVVGNYLSAVVLNSVGNFVFFMVKLTAVLVTVGIGIAMQAEVISVVFGGCAALLCTHCFFVVFEIAVDTVFLCFCEDLCINDGVQKPYCTNTDLYVYIKKAQHIAMEQEQKKLRKKGRV